VPAATGALASNLFGAGSFLIGWRAWWLADLTVAQAAEESGYSEERLRDSVGLDLSKILAVDVS
jgi:hypothetical protein